MGFVQKFGGPRQREVAPDLEPLDDFLGRAHWTRQQLKAASALGFPEIVTNQRTFAELASGRDTDQYVHRERAADWWQAMRRLATPAGELSSGVPLCFTRRHPTNRVPLADVRALFAWSFDDVDEAQRFHGFPRARHDDIRERDGSMHRCSTIAAHELDIWCEFVRQLVPVFALRSASEAA